MVASSDQIQLEKELAEFKQSIESNKADFLSKIKQLVDEKQLMKLNAIELITNYELLPVAAWFDCPEFMDGIMTGDHYGRREIICYSDWLSESNFKPVDGTKPSTYAPFPNITFKEAIDEIYNFMIDKGCMGCYFDW